MTIANIPMKIQRGMKNAFYLCAFGGFMSITAMLSGLNKDFNRFSVSSFKFDLHKESASVSGKEAVNSPVPAEVKSSLAGVKAVTNQ